jgi:hypothetical protein
MFEMSARISSWEKLWHAIGYLSTWSMDSYPYVKIFRDGKESDLVAVYHNAEGDRKYVIGAVWHIDNYGFHS